MPKRQIVGTPWLPNWARNGATDIIWAPILRLSVVHGAVERLSAATKAAQSIPDLISIDC